MVKEPLISVVIPVYNIEAYLTEAIDSVLGQDIGFENNIEILLVNDGSIDNSEAVCLDYVEKYPQNIKYISKVNGGVSSARNLGLTEARGKYIHFFDGDDKLSKGFYKHSTGFLAKNGSTIDFVAVKLKFFDEIIDSHPLNYKFTKDRIIDITSEPDTPIFHVISCLFIRERIKTHKFDEKLSVSEDLKFLSDALFQRKKYGVVTAPTYHYRKRSSASSAIGGKEKNKSYYLDTPIRAYQNMLDKWRNTPAELFADYTLLYDISYRLEQTTESVLTKEERLSYKNTIKDILRVMNDGVIISHRFLSIHKKVYILQLKYENEFQKHIHTEDKRTYFDDYILYESKDLQAHIDFIEPDKATYKIEGYIEGYIADPDKLKAAVKKKVYDVTWVLRAQREASFLGDVYDRGGAFEVEVNLQPGSSMAMELDGNSLPIKSRQFTRLPTYKFSYRCDDRNRLISKSSKRITLHNYSLPLHVLFEIRQLLLILTHWKLDVFRRRFNQMRTRNILQLPLKARLIEVIKPSLFSLETIAMIPRAFIFRIIYFIAMAVKKRPIWIISDRGMAAGDNGEALFQYIMSQSDRPADIFFAISQKSKDYGRLRIIGPVLDYGSLRYKLKFLLADKIISSHADIEVTNPFLRQIDHFVDLFTFDFVFLQHGIIRNDLSLWLNRFNKNISLFVTSAQKEYDSIFEYPYYYDKSTIVLSGMPRYDSLVNNPENKIIIAPTYRNSLLRLKTNQYGQRAYDPSFKHSNYFDFYNSFINDSKLLDCMRKTGMKGEMYIHPNFAAQTSDFRGNDVFEVKSFPYDYKHAISTGSLLISDYSSIVFDFAYLEKPVVYAQFDSKAFFEGQPYEDASFFSDVADGFGEVYRDYKETIDGLIHKINDGCSMDDVYKHRVNTFFYAIDKNNCKRVYDAILDLK